MQGSLFNALETERVSHTKLIPTTATVVFSFEPPFPPLARFIICTFLS